MQALQQKLTAHTRWRHCDVWLGDSAVIWRQGGSWHPDQPEDVDPIVFMRRMGDWPMAVLQRDVLEAFTNILQASTRHSAQHITRPQGRMIGATAIDEGL